MWSERFIRYKYLMHCWHAERFIRCDYLLSLEAACGRFPAHLIGEISLYQLLSRFKQRFPAPHLATAAVMAKCTVYAARCPLGNDCRKKGSLFIRKISEADCRAALKHHLMTSPYHEMEADPAGILRRPKAAPPKLMRGMGKRGVEGGGM